MAQARTDKNGSMKHQDASKTFDQTMIADRLKNASLHNDYKHTGMVNRSTKETFTLPVPVMLISCHTLFLKRIKPTSF